MIRYAAEKDFELLSKYDKHICETELRNCIKTERILTMFNDDIFIGWLRFNLFWDNIPFMNMLYLLEDYRGKGYGSRLVSFWEQEMIKSKYKMVLTSTQSNEQAQFFYRKIGYVDCGSLLLPDEPLEIILLKKLV
ncbi:MAG: GNAT family N-acetyltransferase [Lachnospiraceae bacterium]|nr:GNAT family N-acetyltransferase [Lachnospiraceae bacterium]